MNLQGHVTIFTALCARPAQTAGRGGTRYDPTTCKAHTHLAHDRPIGDCRIAGDHRDWNLDCSLVTNLHSHSVTQRGPWIRLVAGRYHTSPHANDSQRVSKALEQHLPRRR